MESSINWNEFLNIYIKSEYGNQGARQDLGNFISELQHKKILTIRGGYLISCRGVLQNFFGKGSRSLRILDKNVAYDFLKELKKREEDNYSVVEMHKILRSDEFSCHW